MNHLGLFEGIGGFSLAARWAGWHTVAWCEINPFGQQVLKYHFPNATGHGDITKTDFTVYRGTVDIITGGFPCQPYSTAGKRLGKEDERHLWPQMLRAIREVQPRWVVGENVAGLVNWSDGLVFEEVQTDLEAEGYEVLAFVLPACGVDAPHRRDRVWFVAYSENSRGSAEFGQVQSTNGEVPERYDNAESGDTGCDGFVAYASGEPSERMRSEQRSAGISEQREFGGSGGRVGDGVTAYTPSNRRQRQRQRVALEKGLQPRSEPGWQLAGRLERLCHVGDAPNPSNKRLQRSEEQGSAGGIGQESHKQPARCVRPNWAEFPTQPPVCSRDDGFPARLDGIAFSKWRSESVKAYGNAIVPQVALQIFNSINEFELQNSK
jgi:DNA (cytosine-5)-methyltransferase 1